MGTLHAGRQRDYGFCGARHRDVPLAGPAKGSNETGTIHLNIEERNAGDGFAAAFVRQVKLLEFMQLTSLQGIGVHTSAAIRIQDHRVGTAANGERKIKRLHSFKNWRVLVTSV